ncbi:hypothetical protein [Limosilactobacillus pontis]|uniref:hypothetical protein n=1 Tax=Limosilactobacillus pontis TaxID=35787 RepID=UPI002F25EBEF
MEILENLFSWIGLIAFIALIVFGIMVFRGRKDKESKKYIKNKRYMWASLAVFVVAFVGFQVIPTSDDEASEAKTEQTSSKKRTKTNQNSSKEKSIPDSYEQVTYDNLARNSNDWKGKGVTLTGEVIDTDKEDGEYELLVAVNGDTDQIVMVDARKDDKPANGDIIENDLVTVKGVADGKKSYTTVMGSDENVPYVKTTAQVDDQGKASDDYGD